MFTSAICSANNVYTLAATGIKFKSKCFPTRESATQAMYNSLAKNKLTIKEVWNDKHFKTYCCDGDIKFYISRGL